MVLLINPVLFLDYLKSAIPALEGGFPRVIAVLALVVVLTYMNYRGLTIVGWVAIILGVFSILPFVVMGLVSIPSLQPSRWLVVDFQKVNWSLYLNTLFWNLNYWDSVSTLAGEVENPGQTLPKALFYALIFVVFGYFFPLLIGTGAVPLNRELWRDGYLSDVAKILGGVWLRSWVQGASAISNMRMFEVVMSSDSFQLLGMAERGMLPDIFAKRSHYGTSYWDFILCIWCYFSLFTNLTRNCSCREFLILFWNSHEVCGICQAKDKIPGIISAL